MKKTWPIIMLSMILLTISCKKKEERGNVDLCIHYSVNGGPLMTDTFTYVNEAGNTFLISEIQWFLSDIQLLDEYGEWHPLRQRDAIDSIQQITEHIFYIDTNIPESQTLHAKKLPVGKYTSIRFTFGLDEYDNESELFSDPPEANMYWPEQLGGGYHYMKLNGKYVNAQGQLAPLNIHLGIGQNQDLSQFYHNYFIVERPIDFYLSENSENQLDITMIIDNWFRTPTVYDFDEWGSSIMQNQEAQRVLRHNGQDVFQIKQASENKDDMAITKDDILKGFSGLMHKAAPKPHFWRWENVKQTIEQIRTSNQNRS
ncbi:MAG: hypothetical protein IJ057_12080 [Bacteroidales bacterium]|nr:hypothetical protein [Bacteroidales bacterium]